MGRVIKTTLRACNQSVPEFAAGARLARAADALGMRVCGLTSGSPPADLAALLAMADVVSLVSCQHAYRRVG